MVERPDIESYNDAPEIQNVIVPPAIAQKIDLEAFATDFEGIDFDLKKFPGLIYRLEEPHATALIFPLGGR